MATIQKINDRYRVQIRKKDIEIYSSFKNEEDAKLWAEYKEELIDNISAFDPPLKEMITLKDAIELKIEKGKETMKDINDFKNLLEYFDKFCYRSLNSITYDELMKYYDEKLKIPIRKGGSKNNENTGIKKLPSPSTVFRKFQYLSSVYQDVINYGVEIENIPLKICQFMRKAL